MYRALRRDHGSRPEMREDVSRPMPRTAILRHRRSSDLWSELGLWPTIGKTNQRRANGLYESYTIFRTKEERLLSFCLHRATNERIVALFETPTRKEPLPSLPRPDLGPGYEPNARRHVPARSADREGAGVSRSNVPVETGLRARRAFFRVMPWNGNATEG
jgi:hypothetical protein